MFFDLSGFEQHSFLAMICPTEDGPRWSNQVGGTVCATRSETGILVPLPQWRSWVTDPLVGVAYSLYDQKLVTEFLERSDGLKRYFEPLEGPAQEEPLLFEAWVPVRVKEDIDAEDYWFDLFDAVRGEMVILTYANSN